jgi:hypothetical protein
MRFRTIGLMRLITGLGQVWIGYAVHGRESAGPRRPRARGEAGWAVSNSARIQFTIKKFFFFFQICFVNYKSIWIQIKFEFQRLLLTQ